MARRHLSPDEESLWTALTRSVRALRPVVERPVPPKPAATIPARKGLTVAPFRPAAPVKPVAPAPAAMLDSAWERRIRSGSLAPDMTIDLHGHSLAAAHARLNQALSAAIARDLRVILVVTGKPPKNGAWGDGSRRGAIRAEIGQWLGSGSYAASVASVRIAHRRHGGDGALYIILRRKK
ncbi:Smr/MutS family protein [Sphingobium sp. AN558]|uniref:Smr/MutS family protein n=1 Tax=Sphingobium sp. AN558 TaxID=3133442 RepID=UPI0030C124BD